MRLPDLCTQCSFREFNYQVWNPYKMLCREEFILEGKTALAQFIANRGNKAILEAISLAREFSQAESLNVCAGKTPIELLQYRSEIR